MKILIIDDDADIRRNLRTILVGQGYTVVEAEDGPSGVALAREGADLVFCDMNLPGVDGLGVIRLVQQQGGLTHVPFIFVTGRVERGVHRAAMAHGADDYITKPFTPEEIIEAAETRLRKKRVIDEVAAFAATVAHDLRNPLTSFSGRLSLMERALSRDDEEQLRKNLSAAKRTSAQLGAVIDELLLLSGIAKRNVDLTRLDMDGIVDEARLRLDALLRECGAELVVPSAWAPASGYGPWVIHLWTNYLSNAAKYSGPAPRIELGSEVRPGTGLTRFWVRDFGPGLTPEQLAGIFTPFNRLAALKATGHGLGLSITARIAERLRGAVGVEAEPGAGCRFWFDLPTEPVALPVDQEPAHLRSRQTVPTG